MFYARNAGVRDRLKREFVTVVGCGSFGSAIADMLVRAGLGRLALVDPERLAIENVGRHILTAKDVGHPKAVALAERLHEINPKLHVEARNERFSDAAGLVVCAVDSRRCESMVNAVSLAKRLPAVYVGAYGAVRAGEIQFCVPGKTACRECFAQFRPAADPAPASRSYTDPDFDETREGSQGGLWGSILAVSGMAFQGILTMLGVQGALDYERPLWIVNLDYAGFRPYGVTFAHVPRGCAVCDESRITELTVDGSSAAGA